MFILPQKRNQMKAMLFSAGLGTRLHPLTSDRPKALVEIQKNISLLHYNILYLQKQGVNTIVVNIHHFGQKIIAELERYNNFGMKIIVSDEREKLLETGGGLLYAAPLLRGKEPIILYNVDVISTIDLRQMFLFHVQNNALATLACRKRESSRYLLFDTQKKLCGWKNTKTGETIYKDSSPKELTALAFSGIHIIAPRLLDLIEEKGKFSIIKSYLQLMQKKHTIQAYQHDNDAWFDVGTVQKLAIARQYLTNNNRPNL